MARDGSGTYSLYTPGNPVVTGTTISSSAFNNTLNDIASALTLSIASDGQTPITANIPMGSNKITGLAAGTTTGDALAYGQSSALLTSATITTLTAPTLTVATSLTGPTGAILSGTYTPTVTNVTNVNAGSSSADAFYMRVGAVVYVSGRVSIRATSLTGVNFGLSLPIASNLASFGDLAGSVHAAPTGGITTASTAYGISGDTTNDRATGTLGDVGTTAQTCDYVFTFSYRVI